MPTQRFLNLPCDKRARILKAALSELMRVPYEQLSINRIIQEADIPRGSFYQYFSDKKDLVGFIMNEYREKMLSGFKKSLQDSGGDIFKLFSDALEMTVQYGVSEENYPFCKNIFAHIKINGNNPFDLVDGGYENLYCKLLPYANFDLLRDDVKSEANVLVELMITLLRVAVAKIFDDLSKKDEYLKDYRIQLEIIKYGVMKGKN